MGPCYLSTDINQVNARISELANTLAFDEIPSFEGRALARCAGGLIHGQATALFAEFPFEEAFHLGSILGCEPMALDEEIGQGTVQASGPG
jgi:hypothetical protein